MEEFHKKCATGRASYKGKLGAEVPASDADSDFHLDAWVNLVASALGSLAGWNAVDHHKRFTICAADKLF